ncbi:MAG: EamA family transporter [Elusimicrobia bacterium]|nr:EamA family transporter [Elusimicrobiota bacterium]
MTPGSPLVPFLYLLISLIWGSTWLVIKIGLVGVPPFLGAGLRFALASVVLFAILRARGTRIAVDRDGMIAVLSCGLLSFTVSYACVYWSEQYISSGLTAVLYCLMPLSTSLLSRFWTRSETLTLRKVGGILIATAGTVVLFRPAAATTRAELAGMAVALLSVLGASVNLVSVKKYAKHLDVVTMNALGMTIGAVCLLLLSAAVERGATVVWTRANVGAIVYLSLAGSVVTFLSYYSLIKVMEASRLSLITLIIPIVALFLGRVFLGEALPPGAWAGMGGILAGVAIAIVPALAPRR